MHSKAKGGKKDGLDLKTYLFFGLWEFLKKFQEILNSREFSRNFTSRTFNIHSRRTLRCQLKYDDSNNFVKNIAIRK